MSGISVLCANNTLALVWLNLFRVKNSKIRDNQPVIYLSQCDRVWGYVCVWVLVYVCKRIYRQVEWMVSDHVHLLIEYSTGWNASYCDQHQNKRKIWKQKAMVTHNNVLFGFRIFLFRSRTMPAMLIMWNIRKKTTTTKKITVIIVKSMFPKKMKENFEMEKNVEA